MSLLFEQPISGEARNSRDLVLKRQVVSLICYSFGYTDALWPQVLQGMHLACSKISKQCLPQRPYHDRPQQHIS